MAIIGDNDGGRQQLNEPTSSVSGSGLKISKPRSKKIRHKNCDRFSWDDLPLELISKILMFLTIADFFSFGRVSRNLRNLATSCKKEFLESQGPMVVAISSRAKTTCSFFHVAARNTFKTKLPEFCGRLCAGISSGYLIMQGVACDLMLANPLTGHKVEFPDLNLIQRAPYRRMITDRCIFAYTFPQPDYLAVVLSSKGSSIQFRRSRDSEWTLVPFASDRWLVDIIAFESTVYALSNDAEIVALVLSSPPTMKPVLLKDKPQFSSFVSLVASQDELLVVDFCPNRFLEIYRIDFAGSQWVRVFDLGDRSLFLGKIKRSRIFGTTRWGGHANCIYYLLPDKCAVYSIASPFSVVDRFPIVTGNQSHNRRDSYGWYLPSEFETMDYVRDDGVVPENNAQN